MRQKHTTQGSIFWFRPEHEICHFFDRINRWLQDHPILFDWVSKDLSANCQYGRPGMNCDQVLRTAIAMRYQQCSYRRLEFLLKDSLTFQQFCRIDPFKVPGKSALATNISAIRPATWRKLNQCFIQDMKLRGFETGDRLRIDSTVAETHILFPTDSKLLYDAIRMMVRVLRRVRPIVCVKYVNHSRRSKRHWFAATMAKTAEQRYPHYIALLGDVEETRLKLIDAQKVLKKSGDWPSDVNGINQLLVLVSKVMSQTTQRIVLGESVPAKDKVVSLYEPHTDIIKKGGRDVQFGHKLNLSTGKSGLVLDVVIERGNPADSNRFLRMLKRHRRVYGEVPNAVAVDGGYAAQDNLVKAKAMGIESVAFDKRVNLTIEEMTGSDWLYRELKRFRAGIEASISYLKRCFGMSRVTWKGWDNFRSSIYLSVFSHNLIVWARSG